MFLKSLQLKNVKTFNDLYLSFENEDGSIRKWTLLLGNNGTGKSTLLKSIALVTSGSDALSDLLVAPDDWIRYGKKYCEISAVLVTKEKEDREINLRINRGESRTEVLINNKDNLERLDRALKHSSRSYFVVGYGASRRLSTTKGVRKESSLYREVRAQSVATLFDPDATLNPLESWAMDLDYLDDDRGIKTVRRALNHLLPGVKFLKIDKSNGQLLFRTSDGIVPLHSLSDGYQSASAWIGDMLYRIMQVFEDYKSPLDARGLLLIDEIDLHLHLEWQKDLLSFVDQRLKNFQLIVTTHSPMTAQQAGPGELHFMTWENKERMVEQFPGNPRDMLLSQLMLTDAFGIESDESKIVQEKKARYAELKDQKSLSSKEKNEFKELKEFLMDRPLVGRTNLKIQNKHAKLLQKIDKELQERRS